MKERYIPGACNIGIEETRKRGYAETLCGRRRYFTDINSKNNTLRTAAERGAINMPIQGTASDMLKIAINKIVNSAVYVKGLFGGSVGQLVIYPGSSGKKDNPYL